MAFLIMIKSTNFIGTGILKFTLIFGAMSLDLCN